MERTIVIKNDTGLHARPAALLVKKAGEFPCEVSLVKAGKTANAKSIISVLALGIAKGDEIVLATAGEQAAEALASIGDFLDTLKD